MRKAKQIVDTLLESDVDPKAFLSKLPVDDVILPEDVLQHMPSDFQAAHARGESAEWQNQYVEGYDWWPTFDDDDQTWSQITYYPEYATENGVLTEIIRSVDLDGNHEFESEAVVGTPEQMVQHNEYGSEGYFQALDRYYGWVEVNGQDPIDHFHLHKPVNTRKDQWLVAFREVDGRGRFWKARHLGQEPPSQPTENFNDLPPNVKEYCLLTPDGFSDAPWEDIVREGEQKEGFVQVRFETEDKQQAQPTRNEFKKAARKARKENAKYLKK